MIDPYEYHIADEMKRTRTPDKTMTAETDLLPLPDVKRWRAMKDRNGNVGYSDKPDPKYSESAGTDSLTWVRLNDHTAAMRDYARANLAELQREVEGLRRDRDDCLAAREHYAGLVGQMTGEVEGLRAEVERLEIVGRLHSGTADLAINAARAAEARAERLAGALRVIETKLVHSMDHAKSSLERKRAMSECADAARAALDQETTNG